MGNTHIAIDEKLGDWLWGFLLDFMCPYIFELTQIAPWEVVGVLMLSACSACVSV